MISLKTYDTVAALRWPSSSSAEASSSWWLSRSVGLGMTIIGFPMRRTSRMVPEPSKSIKMSFQQKQRPYVPAWLIIKSTFSYSSWSDGLYDQNSISTPALLNLWVAPSRIADASSNVDFPHWTTKFVYPFRHKQDRTSSVKTAWMRASKRVEPTVTKACMPEGHNIILQMDYNQRCGQKSILRLQHLLFNIIYLTCRTQLHVGSIFTTTLPTARKDMMRS